VRLPKLKIVKKSKDLTSLKRECNLLIVNLKTDNKNYGANALNFQETKTARNQNAI